MQKFLLASTAIGLIILPEMATAQEAGSGLPAAAEGEIVVTAQRRAENIQKVPVSVTPLSASALRARNLNDLQQISLAAPSLQLGQENNFSVRGVGTLAFQQTVDPAVAISLDEVSLARPLLAEGLFTDVAQVEVLNGPQGLLFGKNATAGLLNVTTTLPKIGRTGVDGDVEFDYRDTTPGNGYGVIAHANLNLPVSASSALRLNTSFQFQNPVTRGASTGARLDANRMSFEVKAKYLADIGSSLNLYVIGNYGEVHGIAGIFDRTYRSLGSGSINSGPLAADGFAAGPTLMEYRADGANFRDVKTYGAQAKVTYTLPNNWQLINVTAYKGYNLNQAFDQDFTSSQGASISTNKSDFDQFSNELRLALPAGNRLSGQAGLYYLQFQEHSTNAVAGQLYFPAFLLPQFPFCVGAVAVPGAFPPTCSVSNNYAVGSDSTYQFHSKSYAAFGQFTFQATDQLRLIAGGRVTHDDVDVSVLQNQLKYFIRFGGPGGTYSDGVKSTNFSYKVGAQYEPTNDVMLYATYATGYKGPGANNVSSASTARLGVQPETSRNVELGVKSAFFDRRVTFNVALFHTRYKDYQAAAFDPRTASLFIQNAAVLVSKGAELSMSVRPATGLSIDGSATLLDAKFKDFPGASCYVGQAGCANNTFNAAGQRTPMSPKFTSSLGISYEGQLSSSMGIFFGGDWYHRSDVNFGYDGNPLMALSGINIIGARVGLKIGDQLRVSVFCKNCTDKVVPAFVYSEPGDASVGVNSSVQTFGFNSVRTIGARLDFRF